MSRAENRGDDAERRGAERPPRAPAALAAARRDGLRTADGGRG
jgi:hypothetical protein